MKLPELGQSRETVLAALDQARKEGSAAMYGMLGSLPDRSVVRDLVLEVLDGL